MPQLQQQPPQQMLLRLPPRQGPPAAAAAAATVQRGRSSGGSPESIFSDGELDSVLLPPEVMATAIMPFEDFLCDDDDAISLGSLGR